MERMLSSLTLLCLLLTGANAVDVTIPQTLFEVARGDNITVPCTFKTTVSQKLVLLEWSNKADQVDADETNIITYYPADKGTDVTDEYTGRASLDVDIPSGRFNLKLSSVTLNENKRFKCHVQAQSDTSKSSATTRVLVLVAPSPPECNIQGKAEYGQNINITCLSREGSPTPTYKWDSRDVQNNPRPLDPKTTNGGILSLYNISKDTSGFFICTSSNKIRSATCNLTLSVMPPSMNIGSTAGIIAGIAVALLVLAIVVYCCCCRKKNKEEEYAMGVHEDEFHDNDQGKKGDGRQADGKEEVRSSENTFVKSAPDRRDEYEERSERGYDDRRSDYEDRRSDYDDRRDKYSDRHERYDDNRRYDDDRHYNDRRDRRYDDDRYDEPYDDRSLDRPPAPSNKPPRRN